MSDKSDLRVERDEESWDCRPGLEKSRHIAIPDGRRSGSSGSARSTRASSVTSEENVASEPRGFGGGGGGGGGGRSSCSSTSSSSSSISAAPVKRITTTSASLSSSSTTTTTTTVGGGGGGGGGDSGSGRGSHLRYSYEFLKKLQKSKLSRKAPECLAKLRQENILREMWRNENDRRDGGGDREVQLDLGMTRRSFVAGCQIANIQPSDGVSKVTSKLLGSLQSNAGGKDTTTQLTSGGGGGGLHSSKEMSSSTSNGPNPGPVANSRRIGSGRLERTFKDTRGDRDRDYGYGMSDREHQQQQQQQQQQRTMNRRGAFDFRRDSRGDMMKPRRFQMAQREDEPEWFTEGPTSQTDTIELGGFDDARSEPPPTTGNTAPKRSIMTQAAREERERRLDAENARNRRSPSPRMAGHQRRSQWSEKELLEELTSENRKSAGSPLSTRDDDDVDDDNEVDGGSDVEVDHHHHRNRGRRHEDADVDVCGGSGDEDNNNNQNHHPHHHHSKQITPDGDFSSQERGAPINFDHLFLNDERDSPKIDSDEAVIGSRFMSKVFAKASSLPPCSESPVMMTTMTTSQPPSEPPRPILHMLQQQSAVPHDNGLPPPPPAGPPAILRELMHLPPQQPVGGDLGGDMGHPSPLMTMMNNSHPNNGVSGMMPMGPGPQNPLEALLGAQMPPHGPLHHHHPHPLHHGPPMHHHHGMPPMPGAPLDHMNNSGPNNNKGDHISGKNLIELLLLSASAPGTASPPPPPPQHAKSVEQLEADLKLQFSRPSLPSPGQQQQQQQQQQHQQQQQQQPSHPHPQSPFGHGPPHGGLHAAPPPVSSGGLGELGMQPHAPMDRPLNGLMPLTDMDGHCAVGPMGPMGPHFQHGLAPMGLPHHPPQQQQQQHSPGHSAGQNIMRMLAESANRVDMGLGRGGGGGGGGGEAPLHTKQPAFKQDLKNVPTQVLLREKDLLIQREHNNGVGVGVHGAPRPIVKSNKGSPPSGPQPPPPHMLTGQPTTDTGAEFLQKLLQSSQQHHQQQQQHSMSSPLPPTQLGDLFGGNGNMNCNGVPTGVTNSSKMIRSDGSDPPPMPRLQRQPPLHQQQQQQHHYQHQGSLALDQLFAASAATQVGQQQHHHHQQQHTPPPQPLPSQPQQQQQRQQHQQQQPIRMNNMGAPSAPRPLTGMHGQRYGDLPYHSGPHQPHMPMQQLPQQQQQQQQQLPQQAHQQEQNQEQSSLKTQANSTNGEMGLSKWLGNWASGGGSAAMTPSMPRNVLRVEDLERQQQMHHHGNIHHAKMPAAS